MDYRFESQDVQEQSKPVSPFADSPFESVYVAPVYRQPPATPKKEKGNARRLLCFLLVLALLAASCGVTAVCMTLYWDGKMEALNQAFEKKLSVIQERMNAIGSAAGGGGQLSFAAPGQVYIANVSAVVAISNQSQNKNIYGQTSQTASSGSGFIISKDGYIVSNYHVVQGATKLGAITADGTEYEAQLIGFDETNDLAVLKIQAEDLPCVTLGSSDALNVGDMVMAIGNPLGELTSSLTVGYVSAKNRMVSTDGSYMNMLQTDAAINSGNSGGPLFNASGEVVGITTAKYSGTSNSGATIEGIGFAIPIDDVRGMIEDLVEHGYISGAYLGVMVKDVDASVAQSYGLPTGAYVDEVVEGSCAEKAGIMAKDIIVNIGGYDIGSLSELSRVLNRFEAGKTTTITVYREGKEVHLEITFDPKPQAEQSQDASAQQNDGIAGIFGDLFGNLLPGFGG